MVKIDKSVITVIALVISTFHLNSKSVDPDYKPFLYPGKVWTWTYIQISDEAGRTETVARKTVGEKTMINGEECYTIHITSDSDCFEPYDTYMKETDGIVSCSFGEGYDFFDLYNFNVNEGDILAFDEQSGSPEPYIVSETCNIYVNGTNRKFIKLCSQVNDNTVTWVEGIGDCNGCGMVNFPIPTDIQYGFFGLFRECYEDGNLVFTETDFKKAPWDTPSESDYSSLLVDGRVWVLEQTVEYPDWESGSGEDLTMAIKFTASVGEPVTFENHSGRRIDVKYLIQDIPSIIGLGGERNYSIFEIDRSLYVQTQWNSEELLKSVPFNLEVGDKVPLSNECGDISTDFSPSVKGIDSFQLNGRTFKRWIIQPSKNDMQNDKITDVIIEGIGSSCGGYGYILFPEPDNGVYYHKPKVMEIYDNGVLTFTYEGFFTGLEDASVGIVHNEKESTDNSIYDLYGNKVVNPQPGSVYIRNGKKYMFGK